MIYTLVFERDDGALAVVEVSAEDEATINAIIQPIFTTMPDVQTISKCQLIEKIHRTPPES